MFGVLTEFLTDLNDVYPNEYSRALVAIHVVDYTFEDIFECKFTRKYYEDNTRCTCTRENVVVHCWTTDLIFFRSDGTAHDHVQNKHKESIKEIDSSKKTSIQVNTNYPDRHAAHC